MLGNKEGDSASLLLLEKVEHHLESIIGRSEGSVHWPEKYQSSREIVKAVQDSYAPSGCGDVVSCNLFECSDEDEAVEETDSLESPPLLKDAMPKGQSFWSLLNFPSLQVQERKSEADIYNVVSETEKAQPCLRSLAISDALAYAIEHYVISEDKSLSHADMPLDSFTSLTSHTMNTLDSNTNWTFTFREFAPMPFAALRKGFGISRESYIASMTQLQGGQVGGGKSGMLFFSSADKEYVIKTITPTEFSFFSQIFQSYCLHMQANNATSLLPRFFGCYILELPDKPIIRLVVMNNIFRIPDVSISIREVYDLKGSRYKRFMGAGSGNGVLKDLDFCGRHGGSDGQGKEIKATEGGSCRRLYIEPIRKVELMVHLENDVEWLATNNIMDYSLLVGIADTEEGGGEAEIDALRYEPPRSTRTGHLSLWNVDFGGVRAANGDLTPRREIYYMGVIDILQDYNLKKWMETQGKSLMVDSSLISAVNPRSYGQRFLKWMEMHFS